MWVAIDLECSVQIGQSATAINDIISPHNPVGCNLKDEMTHCDVGVYIQQLDLALSHTIWRRDCIVQVDNGDLGL